MTPFFVYFFKLLFIAQTELVIRNKISFLALEFSEKFWRVTEIPIYKLMMS